MSHAIRRRGTGDLAGAPVDLQIRLRHLREDFQANVRPSVRRHRWFVGPAERRRAKIAQRLRLERKKAARRAA